jgi:MarR family transcriptional regulator, transcriptional regulator for hemolysin
MEKQGLVRRWREESNRRVQRVELTPEGEAMFGRLRGVAMTHDARLREGFSEDELAQLAQLLDRLKASVSPVAD